MTRTRRAWAGTVLVAIATKSTRRMRSERVQATAQPYAGGMSYSAPEARQELLDAILAIVADPAIPDDEDPAAWVRSCVIVTTRANELLEPLHSRMPVMLDDDGAERWLDPASDDLGALEALLRPAPDEWLEVYPVTTRVNSPDNNDADLVRRVESDTLL